MKRAAVGLLLALAAFAAFTLGGSAGRVSEREVDLMRYLASHSGRAISRDELLSRVWRMDPKGISTRTIDMHIARLREKLEADPARPKVILTVRGKGYMFAANGAPPAASDASTV